MKEGLNVYRVGLDNGITMSQNRYNLATGKPPRWMRKKIKDRDKVCQKCGSIDNLTIDHIIPYSKGGKATILNLQVLCRWCNLSKGDE